MRRETAWYAHDARNEDSAQADGRPVVAGGVATPAAIAGPRAAGSDGQGDAAGRAAGAGPGRANAPLSEDGSVSTGELVNMLDTYAIVQAQDALTLNDAQYGQFVTRLKRLQEARRRNQRERNQILQDLRKLSGPQAPTPVDESARARAAAGAARARRPRRGRDCARRTTALDEVLDVRQQARFRVFEETIERRKLDLLDPRPGAGRRAAAAADSSSADLARRLTLRVESGTCVPCVSP